MAQGTITHMQANGDWTSSSGKQFFQFEITIDGNVTGQVNAISAEPWFDLGMIVEWENAGQSPRGDVKLKIRKVGSDFGTAAAPPPEQKTDVPAYPKNFVQDNQRRKEIRAMWAMKMALQVKGPDPDLAQRAELDYCKNLKSLAQCMLIAVDDLTQNG